MAKSAPDPVELVLEKIRQRTKFDFRSYKRTTLKRRVERRLAERQLHSVDEYLALLDGEPAEIRHLLSSMLIKVTSFFRDPEMWTALRRNIIPSIVARKHSGDEIRVWCAGCATGEEAYSVAIAFQEQLGTKQIKLKVFGTDVDETAVATARRGIYSMRQLEHVPKDILERWFIQSSEGLLVRKDARRDVVFGLNNLVTDAPISRLDLLLCRNVFIYLDSETQERILRRFHYALRFGGILALGKSELIPAAAALFDAVDVRHRIYRKDGKTTATAAPRGKQRTNGDDVREEAEVQAEMRTFTDLQHDVLDSLPHVVVTTELDGTIVQWNSAAARLWSKTEGQVLGKRLASLSLAGIRGEVFAENGEAVAAGSMDVAHADVSLTRPGEGNSMSLHVEVSALRNATNDRVGLLYVITDVTNLRTAEDAMRVAVDARQQALEEVQTVNGELQSANEELETTNEELQSANEELQTTNEELQSTNEELETTNEELQSTNAELDATNNELEQRTRELNLLGLYHRTILRSLTAAVVVVDVEGRVTMWNLAAERVLGVPETEALGQRLWTLHVPAFPRAVLQSLRQALTKKQPVRVNAQKYRLPAGGEGVGRLIALPLADGKLELGAVILFEDETLPKRTPPPREKKKKKSKTKKRAR